MPGDSPMVWSFSRLSTFLSCSLQYWWKYHSQEEPVSVSSSLLLGSGIHYGHQLIYEGMAQGKIPSLAEVKDGVIEEIRLRQKISPPVKYSNGGDIDKLVAEAQTLTEVLYRSVKPEPVVSVNEEEIVDLTDGEGDQIGKLKVIYDLIVGDGKGETIVDLKTAKTFQEERLRWDLQPSCYLLARRNINNGEVPVSFRFDVVKKCRQPVLVQYPVIRDESDFQRLIAIVRLVEKGISAGIFLPNRGSMSCHSCGYEPLCAGWHS